MLLSTHAYVVPVDAHHLLYLREDGHLPVRPYLAEVEGLVYASPGAVVILTGVDSGPVSVVVEHHDAAPGKPSDSWEETGEIHFVAIDGLARLGSFGSTVAAGPPVTPPGPGRYGLSVSCRGRGVAFDETVSEPVEDYLIRVWPLASAGRPDTVDS